MKAHLAWDRRQVCSFSWSRRFLRSHLWLFREAFCRYLQGGGNPLQEGAQLHCLCSAHLCTELCKAGALLRSCVPAQASPDCCCCSCTGPWPNAQSNCPQNLANSFLSAQGRFIFQPWEVLETLLMSSAEEITQGTVGEVRLLLACQAWTRMCAERARRRGKSLRRNEGEMKQRWGGVRLENEGKKLETGEGRQRKS